MIVAIFVVGDNPVDPLTNHLTERMVGQRRISRVPQARDEAVRQTDLVIELADG